MAILDAPKINTEIKITSTWDYIKQVDTSLKGELDKDDSRVIDLLNQLISLEISKYVLFHIGGERPFDQMNADTYDLFKG